MTPYLSHSFTIEIDGISRGDFQEVSGLESTIEVVEYREGGDPTTTRKLPGRTSYSNITLKWGMADDTDLYQWHRDAINGNVARRDGSIVLRDARGAEVSRWNFSQAWPTKWTGPPLNAQGNDVAIETLELAHHGVERA